MTLLRRKAQMVIELESVEGSAETLEGADVFMVYDPDFTPEIEMNKRDPVRSTLSNHASLPGARQAKMKFKCELAGSGAAGTAPYLSDLLQACGCDEATVVGTSVTYTPLSDSVPSATLAYYLDGKIHKMWGARGTAKLAFEIGKPVMIEFEFTGADFSVTDGALLSSGVSYHTTTPPPFLGVTITYAAYTVVIGKMDFDMGNVLELRQSAAASSGHVSCMLTGREPKISFDPEDVLVATKDFFGLWRAGTTGAFSCAVGSVAGNIITLAAPKLQTQVLSLGDRNGIALLNYEGLCVLDSTGDDEWSLAFT